jgi:hypothetical protein
VLDQSPDRRLLSIALAYLPVPLIGAALSARWGVGATPDGSPRDMVLRGTALTPPLFLPVALVVAAAAARRAGWPGRAGAATAAAVGAAFLAGSTANLPNDLAAARAAGSPRPLTLFLAAIHAALGATLVATAVAAFRAERGRRP